MSKNKLQSNEKHVSAVLLLSYCTGEELLFKEEEWVDDDGVILDIELKEFLHAPSFLSGERSSREENY